MIGLFKAEIIHRRGPWRSFEFATLEWVDWFNERRLLEPIGNIPPAEAEKAYYAQLEAMPIAASNSNQMASRKPGAVHYSSARRPCLTCARLGHGARCDRRVARKGQPLNYRRRQR